MTNRKFKTHYIIFFVLIFCACKKESDCSSDPNSHRLGTLFGTWNVIENSTIYAPGHIAYAITISGQPPNGWKVNEHCVFIDNYRALNINSFICFYPGQNTCKFPGVYKSGETNYDLIPVNHEFTRVSNSRLEFKRIEIHCNSKIEFHGVMTKS